MNKLFAIIIVLNLSGLYRMLGGLLGLPLKYVTATMVVLTSLYCLKYWKEVLGLLRKKSILFWILVILIWPLIGSLFTLSPIYWRDVILLFYYCVLILSTYLYAIENGWNKLVKLLYSSLFVGLFGLVLSYVYSDFFLIYYQSIEESLNFISNYQNRAFGFYMQPNRAAYEVVLLLIPILLHERNNRKLYFLLISLAGIILIATGSRAGIASFLIITSYIYVFYLPNQSYSTKKLIKSTGVRYVGILLFIIFAYIVLFAVSKNLGTSIETSQIADRVEYIVDFEFLTIDQNADKAFELRSNIENEYISYIQDNFVLGHGLSAKNYFVNNNLIYQSTHNLFLLKLFEYGIFYLLFFIYVLYYTFFVRSGKNFGVYWFLIPFFIHLFIFSVTHGNELDSMAFYHILGLFIYLKKNDIRSYNGS